MTLVQATEAEILRLRAAPQTAHAESEANSHGVIADVILAVDKLLADQGVEQPLETLQPQVTYEEGSRA